jgi:hypothetical protein
MPCGPKCERCPTNVVGSADHVHIEHDVPTPEDEGKDPAAVALGRRGGKARAQGMSAQAAKVDCAGRRRGQRPTGVTTPPLGRRL